MKNQGFETFYPLFRRRTGVYTSITLPLFPGYVFVAFDITEAQWRSLNGTRGVLRVMSMDDERPSAVPELVMRDLIATGGIVEDITDALPFLKGQTLEITEGPLKGHRGTCEMPGPKRVALFLSVLGGKTLVYSDPAHLKLAAKDETAAVR